MPPSLSTVFLLPFLLAPLAAAHVGLSSPSPIKINPANDDHKGPMHPDGSEFPCHYPRDQFPSAVSSAVPEVTWAAGSQQSFSLFGTQEGRHNGGRCQLSLSYDLGDNWWVIEEYEDCPAVGIETPMPFQVPEGIPASDKVLFGWSWHNRNGNSEMYMNCAVVSITSSVSSPSRRSPQSPPTTDSTNGSSSSTVTIPFKTSPAGKRLFVANQAGINSCYAMEGEGLQPTYDSEALFPWGPLVALPSIETPKFIAVGTVKGSECEVENVLSGGFTQVQMGYTAKSVEGVQGTGPFGGEGISKEEMAERVKGGSAGQGGAPAGKRRVKRSHMRHL